MSDGSGSESSPALALRSASGRERVHILTGRICNNNCIFCMEDDREGRAVATAATTDEVVKWILADNRGCSEICFTSGEPTTNPRLPTWARWAREQGAARVSLMTNGRALSYPDYTARLIRAGINRFYISIHGHESRLHQALTRTPDSFAQTVAGLAAVVAGKSLGVELHTSTVVCNRNLDHLGDIYGFLRERGVDQVIFNVMQANGRADTYFERIFPRYADVAARAAGFFAAQSELEHPVMAFVVDIPLCMTTALPDFNRGFVESYRHYEPAASAALLEESCADDRRAGPGGELVTVKRADLDRARREKRAECRACRYDGVCAGVWHNYLRRYGWDEFVPVDD